MIDILILLTQLWIGIEITWVLIRMLQFRKFEGSSIGELGAVAYRKRPDPTFKSQEQSLNPLNPLNQISSEELEKELQALTGARIESGRHRMTTDSRKDTMSLASQIKSLFGRKDKEIARLKTQKENLEKNNRHLQSELESLAKANAAYKGDLDEVKEFLRELEKPLAGDEAADDADEPLDTPEPSTPEPEDAPTKKGKKK